ncbi:MAG: hypothetical protein HY718_15140 [Planctomycetes bacterium]|nr:hypothetical protein [Planctomycetota bacterium]
MEPSEPFTNSGSDGSGQTPLCPGCLAELSPGVDFCGTCGMPVSPGSVIEPLKQVQATGWAYRRVLHGRPSRIVLIGMWLIMGPMVILPALGVFYQADWSWDWSPARLEDLLAEVLYSGFAVLYAIILYKVTANYFRYHSRQRPH